MSRRSEVVDLRAERSIGPMFSAIQLLLGDLIDAVQALGEKNDDKLSVDGGLPWSVTGQLTPTGIGNADYPATPNAVRCKAIFSKAQPVTVQFSLDALGAFPQATVSWRIGGNTTTRTIDVTAGCSISGFAEQVDVVVSDQTNRPLYLAAVNPYNCTITISPGTRPTSAVSPVYTGAVAANLNNGATKVVQVPLGASGVQVYGVSGGGAAQLRVDHYTSGTIGGSPAAVKINSAEIDSYVSGFQPLIAGVSQIQITNEGAAPAVVTVVFSIDG